MAENETAESTPLAELVSSSAGFGRWKVKVAGPPKEHEYTYQWDGRAKTGKSFSVVLLSSDATQYCYGKFTRRGKEPKATEDFAKAKTKFQDGSVWLLTKPTLTKDKKLYIGSSVKAVVDLNSSTMTPVLQSTEFAQLVPTPAESLETLLQAPASQRVDITALVVKISEYRTHVTACGPRLITDVTIRDASGPTGASECRFSMFFVDSASGRAEFEDFCKCQKEGVPVAFFNLSVHGPTGKKTMKPHRDEFAWMPARTGSRAAELSEQIQALRSAEQATCVAEIPEFVAQEAVDYVLGPATVTVTKLLREVLRAQDEFPEDPTHLFQLNHVRVIEPAAGEQVLTADGTRLFVPVTLEDIYGQVQLRMREKAALELSQVNDRNSFCEEIRKGGLNFPILASVRVLVRNRTMRSASGATQEATEAGATEHGLSAILVEAVEQTTELPKSMPNASMNFVMDLLKPFGVVSADRMCVAPVKSVRHSAHGGLLVEDNDGARHACASVLTLVAHVGRCTVQDLPEGHRIVTVQTWNVPFEEECLKDEGAPEHTDSEVQAQFIAYCTMSNVQHVTLSSRKAKQPTYAAVVLGSSHMHNGATNFMLNKVQILAPAEIAPTRKLFHKLALLGDRSRNAADASAVTPKREWTDSSSPFSAKRARQLASCPTDVSI